MAVVGEVRRAGWTDSGGISFRQFYRVPPAINPDRFRRNFRNEPIPLSSAASSPPRVTSVIIVAEHALVRAGLRAILQGTPGFQVVGEAPDVSAAARVVSRHEADLVLLDAPPSTPEHDAAVAALRGISPTVCLLCLGDSRVTSRAELPCLSPSGGVAELCSVVGSVLGERCGGCAFRGHCRLPDVAVALSRREREVAIAVAQGMSSKQIAVALGIGLRTVNTYRESLARKLGGSSAALLTRYVLANNLHG